MTTSPFTTLLIVLATLLIVPFTSAQIAAGGGVAPAPSLAATQYPTVLNVPKILIQGGVTTSQEVVFTQTFASTALGTWAFPTPAVGTIGLGEIEGQVGEVKSAR
jgi:hypothetical protein